MVKIIFNPERTSVKRILSKLRTLGLLYRGGAADWGGGADRARPMGFTDAGFRQSFLRKVALTSRRASL
jgi:hypothetical protein